MRDLTVEQLEKILTQFLKDHEIYASFMANFTFYNGKGRERFLNYLNKRLSNPATCIYNAFVWGSIIWCNIDRDWRNLVRNGFEGYLNNTTPVNIF